MSDQAGELFLLVHGTGAGHPAEPDAPPEDCRWWETRGAFAAALRARLGDRARFPEPDEEFRWSGRNSERARRDAGRALLERLDQLERDPAVPGYHLVGHSHGGSVLWHALRGSAARFRPLKKLRSWATVGTPFLHFGVRRSRWLDLIPLAGGAAAAWRIGWLLAFVYQGIEPAPWPMIREVEAEVGPSRFWAAAALLALALLGVAALAGVVAGRVALTAWVTWRSAVERRRDGRALRWYGRKYLGLWCTSDEAINGLRHAIGMLGVPIVRRIRPRRGRAPGGRGRLAAWALAPFRLAYVRLFGPPYNVLFAAQADAFINDWLTIPRLGSDLRGRFLRAVTTGPVPGHTFGPLPPGLEAELEARANWRASRAVGELRRRLGESATGVEFLVTAFGPERLLGKRDLVHTQYFGDAQADAQLVELIARHAAGDAADAAPAGATGDWLSASRARFVAGLPRRGTDRRRPVPNGPAPRPHETVGAALVRLLTPRLMALSAFALSTFALRAALGPYTIGHQVKLVVEAAPIEIAGYGDASKAPAARHYTRALVAWGGPQAALRAVDSVHEPAARCDLHLEIARESTRRGRPGDAAVAIRLAFRDARELEPGDDQRRRLIAIMQAAADAGLSPDARKVAEVAIDLIGSLPFVGDRWTARREIALAAARAGLADEAVRAALQLHPDRDRILTYVEAARAAAQARQPAADSLSRRASDAAREYESKAAKSPELAEHVPEVLTFAAVAAVEARRLEDARCLAGQAMLAVGLVRGPFPRGMAYAQTAGAAARAGLTDQAGCAALLAIGATEAMPEPGRSSELGRMAEAFALAGLEDEALTAADRIHPEQVPSRALVRAAHSCLSAGRTDAARRLAHAAVEAAGRITLPWREQGELVEAGEVAARAGQPEAAGRAALRIFDLFELSSERPPDSLNLYPRSTAARAILLAAHSGRGREARNAASRALAAEQYALSHPLRDGPSVQVSLAAVISAASEVGLALEARRVARDAIQAFARDGSWPEASSPDCRELAAAAAAAGLVAGAVDAAGRVSDAQHRSTALDAIERAVTDRGQLIAMVERAARIKDDAARHDVFGRITRLAARLSDPDLARRVARDHISPNALRERSAALAAAAGAMARAGRFYEARRLAEACLPVDRLDASAAILEEYNRRQ